MSSIFASFAPPSPSLKSLGSSRASSPFDMTEFETPTVQADELGVTEHKHPLYYFQDGNLVFLLEEKLYNVHRYFFERDSSYFRSILDNAAGADAKTPLVLPGLSCSDFDEFLAILYPTDFRRPMEKTTSQWTSVLHLAAKWDFESIKLLAIDNLAANAAPVDKIVLGRRYEISEWLPEAYEAVCTRENPLTVEEGAKLSLEDVVKISAARQIYGCGKPRFEAKYLSQDLGDIFGLEGKSELPSVAPTGDEDEAIKALEGEVSDAQAAFIAVRAMDNCTRNYGISCNYNTATPYCTKCGHDSPAETEECRFERENKVEKERRLKDLTDKRQQKQQDLAAKHERMSYFRY